MKNKEKTFEERVNRLQTIVSSLEKEDISLADSIELYKEGILHIKECRKQLAEAKNIVEVNTNGTITPFDSPAVGSASEYQHTEEPISASENDGSSNLDDIPF